MTTLFGNRTRVRRTENGKITWNNTESHTRLCYCVSIFLSRGTHSIETKSDGTFCFIALRNSIELQLSHGERKRLSFLCFFNFHCIFFPSIQWSFNLLRNVIELCWHLPFWKCALVNDEWEVSVASVMYYLFTFIQSFFLHDFWIQLFYFYQWSSFRAWYLTSLIERFTWYNFQIVLLTYQWMSLVSRNKVEDYIYFPMIWIIHNIVPNIFS